MVVCTCNCVHCIQCPYRVIPAAAAVTPPTPPLQGGATPATPRTPAAQPRRLVFTPPRAPRKNTPRRQVVTERTSRSDRAGLVMPVARVDRLMRERTPGQRLSEDAAVYMASTMEYLVAEVLDLAGEEAQLAKKKRVTPRHIRLGVGKDEELQQLLDHVIIPGGGVLPSTPIRPPGTSKATPKGPPGTRKGTPYPRTTIG